ncbi:hypothetical protein ACVWWQ_000125 [Rhodanobacter sp. TND4EL1]
MTSRDVLQQRLDELEAMMPGLVSKYPDRDDLLQEFCGYADQITEETTAETDAWANAALDDMLTRHGYPPLKDELPADG